MTTLLKVEDLKIFYGSIEALKGISLTVDEGEIVTVLGANGAGKSTLLRAISGLLFMIYFLFLKRGVINYPEHYQVVNSKCWQWEGV